MKGSPVLFLLFVEKMSFTFVVSKQETYKKTVQLLCTYVLKFNLQRIFVIWGWRAQFLRKPTVKFFPVGDVEFYINQVIVIDSNSKFVHNISSTLEKNPNFSNKSLSYLCNFYFWMCYCPILSELKKWSNQAFGELFQLFDINTQFYKFSLSLTIKCSLSVTLRF